MQFSMMFLRSIVALLAFVAMCIHVNNQRQIGRTRQTYGQKAKKKALSFCPAPTSVNTWVGSMELFHPQRQLVMPHKGIGRMKSFTLQFCEPSRCAALSLIPILVLDLGNMRVDNVDMIPSKLFHFHPCSGLFASSSGMPHEKGIFRKNSITLPICEAGRSADSSVIL